MPACTAKTTQRALCRQWNIRLHLPRIVCGQQPSVVECRRSQTEHSHTLQRWQHVELLRWRRLSCGCGGRGAGAARQILALSEIFRRWQIARLPAATQRLDEQDGSRHAATQNGYCRDLVVEQRVLHHDHIEIT